MSRRFGRNQKRAMRTEMERLSSVAKVSQERANKISSELFAKQMEERDFLDTIVRIVGDAAVIAGKPPLSSAVIANRDLVPVHNPISRFIGNIEMENEYIKCEIMHVLQCEAICDVLRHQIHFETALAGLAVGYAISRSALIGIPEKDLAKILEQRIARSLGQNLAKLIKEKIIN